MQSGADTLGCFKGSREAFKQTRMLKDHHLSLHKAYVIVGRDTFQTCGIMQASKERDPTGGKQHTYMKYSQYITINNNIG